MSSFHNFEEYRRIEQKIRDLSKKLVTLEKERDELERKKRLEIFFNNEK